MKPNYEIPLLPMPFDFETREILRQVNRANRALAELKGVALTIPNENILLNSLVLQEALDSSAIENIVTTSDDLYKAELNLNSINNAAAKEVLRYREAMQTGFQMIRKHKLLTLKEIKEIQAKLEANNAGFRSVPGTRLMSSRGETVYIPPQDPAQLSELMSNLEKYINEPVADDVDPLIKLAVIHHQFESIHPFYDGNGRTGRIIAILYLVVNDLLDLPILYLSRYITHNKGEYYRLIQEVRDNAPDNHVHWQRWIMFMLRGIEQTASETIKLVKSISALMAKFKSVLRPAFGQLYKHELLNNLFFHPYTKIEFIQRDLMVQRKTASRYLDRIVELGLLEKMKHGRSNYYINNELMDLFVSQSNPTGVSYARDEAIESVFIE